MNPIPSSHVFDGTLHKSNAWVADLMVELRARDPQRTLSVLRSGLHALRDHLPLPVVAELSAQLPMLLRGLFFEGWRPSEGPSRMRDREDFFDELQDRLSPRDIAAPAAFEALVRVLRHHLTPGLMAQIAHVLPRGIRSAWLSA